MASEAVSIAETWINSPGHPVRSPKSVISRKIDLWQGYPADNLGTGNPVAAARDRAPSTQVHTTAPSATVGARATHKKRRSYVRQDWARFDALMGNMIYQTLDGTYPARFGGRYIPDYGASDPLRTQYQYFPNERFRRVKSQPILVHTFWLLP